MKYLKRDLNKTRAHKQDLEGNFTILPKWLCVKYGLDLNAGVILSEIGFFPNGYKRGITALQCLINAHYNTVADALKILETRGFITVNAGEGGKKIYISNVHKELLGELKAKVPQKKDCHFENERHYTKEELDGMVESLDNIDELYNKI